MKRKQQRRPEKSGQQLPSKNKQMGDEVCFPNKKRLTNPQNSDFQNLGYLFFKAWEAAKELGVRLNPNTFIVPSNLPEIINPQNTIVNPIQNLNWEDKINHTTSDHIGFLLKPEYIKEFFSIFYSIGLTKTKEEDFIPHFLGGTTNGKIIWLRENNLLTFTFEYLMIEGVIPYYGNLWKVLAEHFCHKNERDYTSEQLRRNHSKKVQDMKKMDLITNAFSSLIKKVDVR